MILLNFLVFFFCRRKSILMRAQIWKKCDFFFCIFCHLKSLTIKNFVAIKYKNSSSREFFCCIRIRFLFNAHFDVTILFYTMILDISPPFLTHFDFEIFYSLHPYFFIFLHLCMYFHFYYKYTTIHYNNSFTIEFCFSNLFRLDIMMWFHEKKCIYFSVIAKM